MISTEMLIRLDEVFLIEAPAQLHAPMLRNENQYMEDHEWNQKQV
jgi:hypothetical protein